MKDSPGDGIERGQVTAVVRALGLLEAFGADEPRLTLAELSRRVALPKSSALRLARTLESRGYLARLDDGSWRLGHATARLAQRYQVAFDAHNVIEPAVRGLARATGGSVSYFVPDGAARIRLLHVSARKGGQPPAPVGEPKPMDKGSPGQVLLAFSGRSGKFYEEIRRRGWHVTIGEASPHSASISAPVFGPQWRVVGALCIGAPASEVSEKSLAAHAPRLLRAAERLSQALMAAPRRGRIATR